MLDVVVIVSVAGSQQKKKDQFLPVPTFADSFWTIPEVDKQNVFVLSTSIVDRPEPGVAWPSGAAREESLHCQHLNDDDNRSAVAFSFESKN